MTTQSPIRTGLGWCCSKIISWRLISSRTSIDLSGFAGVCAVVDGAAKGRLWILGIEEVTEFVTGGT